MSNETNTGNHCPHVSNGIDILNTVRNSESNHRADGFPASRTLPSGAIEFYGQRPSEFIWADPANVVSAEVWR